MEQAQNIGFEGVRAVEVIGLVLVRVELLDNHQKLQYLAVSASASVSNHERYTNINRYIPYSLCAV